ncbi:ATP-dependent zinc metalloprotease FtsH 4 [bacterium BMS3Abin02]|nr:ATP-dependent zinc metalloprotease FtsH 4 [bacterium BMS3Abin02]
MAAGNVHETRERQRQRRLTRLGFGLAPIAAWMWWRILNGHHPWPTFPHLPPETVFWLPGILIILLIGIALVVPVLGNRRSPHTTFRPEQIEISFDDVKGLGNLLIEVRHTLQILLDHERLRTVMGGTPRRGVLFEGPPGTGKTHAAKALAKEAGVPFLFVSATAFQSMWYGMTSKRIRAFFKALRKAARVEGGAIGFIEEIDAIGLARPNVSKSSPVSLSVNRSIATDTGGVVNELLIQMQSFDEPLARTKMASRFRDRINLFLPEHLQLRPPPNHYSNVLLIGATNRVDSLDPALLRPGRFDRIFHFDLPGRTGRRELIDYFLTRKAHVPEMELEASRDDLAAATLGYTPASLERLFDEALLLALRDGRGALDMRDLHRARIEIELGLPEPVDYPAEERAAIATHEAGHATVAYLVGKGRRLEVLSIVKRREALGFLAHRLTEERRTQRESELRALLQIAMGGMVAEEIFFGDSSTGPAGDLASATTLAAEMVGSLGLGDSLVSYQALDAGLLGGNLTARVLSDPHGREQMDHLLDQAKQSVTRLLSANLHIVEALRDALIERNELIDQEILDVIGSASGEVVIDLRETPLKR